MSDTGVGQETANVTPEAEARSEWTPPLGQAVDICVAAVAAGTAAWLMWDRWELLYQTASTMHQLKQAHMGMAAVTVGGGMGGFAASWSARAVGRGVVAGFRAVCMEGWLVGKFMDAVHGLKGTNRQIVDQASSVVAKQVDGQKMWVVSAVNAEGEALNATVMSVSRYEKFQREMAQKSAPVLEMHFEGEELVSIEAIHQGEKVRASTISDFNEALDNLRRAYVATAHEGF